MPNPPSITLVPGVAQAFTVVVTANGVLPDGTNPGVVDTTSVLTFENVQGTTGSTPVAVPSVDPGNNHRVIVTPGTLNPGSTPLPWSFRVKVVGRTAFVAVSGSTSAPPDVSGVAWDGNPVGPA
jgi:hypothetical protein